MIIGIDIRDLETGWAGRKRFTQMLVKALLEIDLKNDYVFFTTGTGKINFSGNFTVKKVESSGVFWHFEVAKLCNRYIDLYVSPRSPIVPAIIKRKSIVIVHDLIAFRKEGKMLPFKSRFVEKLFMKKALMRAVGIAAVSESTRRDIVRLMGISPSKIKVIYEAADPIFRKIKPDKKVLNKYGINGGFILFVGTIEPRKNLKCLLEAYNLLDADLKNRFRLVLVGKKGWKTREIFDFARSLIDSGRVVFTGFVPDSELVHLYNAATVFVYPSLYEGFGLPVLEAMSCGLPVIASDVSSLPELVNSAGILVSPFSPADLQKALEYLLRNEKIRDELAAKALKRSRQFSWKKVAEGLISMYC